jgi:hypothetical protein
LLPERYFYMATYKDTVLADAPLLYYTLDDTQDYSVTGKPVANSGSVGGSATTTLNSSGTITKATSVTAGYIGGQSFRFNNNQAYAAQSAGTFTATRDASIEFWWKRDTGYAAADGALTLAKWAGNGGSVDTFDVEIGATFSSPQVLVNWNGGTMAINSTAVGNVTDGNWHHFVVTFTGSDRKFRLYIDGALKITSTAQGASFDASSTGGTFSFGAVTTNGADGWVDEPAFYNKVLTLTQIQSHYTAATTVPQVDIAVAPPVMTASLTAPNASVAAYTPVNINVAAPALAVSMDSVTPSVTIQTFVREDVTADKDKVSGTGTTLNLDNLSGSNNSAFFQFPTTVPTGKSRSGIGNFNFTYTGTSAVGQTYKVQRITSSWVESNATSPTVVDTSHTGTFVTGLNTVDISEAIAAWESGAPNYGIAIKITNLVGSGETSWTIPSRENATTANRPYAQLSVTDVVVPVSVSAPVMTLNLTAPAVAASAQRNITNDAPVAALELFAADAGVSTQVSVICTAQAISADLAFIGGSSFNPDFSATATVMTLGLTSPNARQLIEYNAIIEAPATYLGNLENEPATINLTTNRLTVAPVMNMNMKWVGMYIESADRYLTKIAETVSAHDLWYRMDDVAGSTRALDYISDGTNWKQSGYYFGSPAMQIPDGPQLRKAVHFDGVDDYMIVGPYTMDNQNRDSDTNDVTNGMAVTVEFSIRTTQQNGVVFVGSGAGDAVIASQSQQYYSTPTLNGNELRIENGELVVANSTTKIRARKNIADGQWHHIVMAIPSQDQMTATYMNYGSDLPASYIVIDGSPVLVRYGSFLGDSKAYGGYWLPYTFMARATSVTSDPANGVSVNGLLSGDVRDLIVRYDYLPRTEAEDIYYEWGNSTILNPEPITLSLDATPPFSVKGNVKKMLAIYGLPYSVSRSFPSLPLYNYMSALSDLIIENFGGNVNPGTAGGVGGSTPVYYTPKSFTWGGYFVVPVNINGKPEMSIDGVLNSDNTMANGRLVDDTTGMPRFLDLQSDLSADVVREYDTITVVNYPAEKQDDGVFTPGVQAPSWHSKELIPFNHLDTAMSDEQYAQAREAFRDSILQAAYDGCNLWIGEYHMAQHLGFIQGYDIHGTGQFDIPGRNIHAQDIDNQHLSAGNKVSGAGAGQVDYFSYPQANLFRRIVALVPGLTDLASYEFGLDKMVEGWNSDDYRPNGNYLAYDIVRRESGLQLGDHTRMTAVFEHSKYYGQTSGYDPYLNPRKHFSIVSAQPQGVAGTIIAREQVSYYGPDGVVVDNPFKDNAVTIAAERGTLVRGRAIRGRAFIELMETESDYYIPEDKDKTLWGGNRPSAGQVSTWDFDSRRSKEVKATVTNTRTVLNKDTGMIEMVSTTTTYLTFEGTTTINHLHVGMHTRGLNWLSEAPAEEAGDVRVYANTLTLNLAAPNATLNKTSSPAIQVVGAMRLDLEVRQPKNFSDGSVTERALPIEMSLELRGLGREIAVPPMSLTVTTPNPTLDVEADLVTVYIDGGRNITLFLKEDN